MSYELRYPDAAQALFESLSDDAFYTTLASAASADANKARAAMLRYLDYSLVEARNYGIVSFPANARQGAAAWSRPLHEAQATELALQKKSFIEQHMGGECLSVYQAITSNMDAETSKYVPDNCWYLSIVGIAPEAQGRGLGRELVEEVLRQADAAGVSSYLETFTPRNISFYQRLGYVDAATICEPVTGTEYTVMLRQLDVLSA